MKIAELNKSLEPSNIVNCSEHGEVKGTIWEGELVCPYHQRVGHDSEGVPYLMWDEFDQDGE